MTKYKDVYTLSTGRTFKANRGIIGISPDWRLTEGYDGAINVEPNSYGETDGGDFQDFTPEERDEIADWMMLMWKTWARGNRFQDNTGWSKS